MTGAIYRDGNLVGQVSFDDSLPRRGRTDFIWIDLHDPVAAELQVLQERFALHSLAVRDMMGPTQAPKLDLFEDQVYVVLKVARLDMDEIVYGEIEAFLSTSHIITVHRGEDTAYLDARRRLESGPRAARAGPDFILHAVADFVVESYFPVVQMMEDEVLAMEQQLLDGLLDRDGVTRLFLLRRQAIGLQHVLARMSDVCSKLMLLELPCIGHGVRPYFRDVHERLLRLDSMIGGLVDVIRAVFETSNLLEQQRQGTITRQLAAWAAILGVPTAIAGAWGMNFRHVPWADLPHSFAIALSAMLCICLALYVRFRTLGWL